MIGRAAGLILALPLAGFALEAALGASGWRPPGRAWAGTLALGGGAVLVALAFGIPAGLVLAGSRSAWPRALTLMPPLLPPVVAAAAWSGAGLPAPGLAGCAAILGLLTWPVVAFALEASLRRLPASSLEAAALQLGTAATLRRVVGPHVRPSLGAAALLVFLLAASEFTLPATFVVPSVSMLVYEEMSAFRHGAALAAALPLFGLAGLLAWILRRVPALPAAGAPAAIPVPAAARAVAGIAWILGAGVPLAVFARRASWPAFEPALEALAWSLLVSAGVALPLTAWSWLTPGRSRLEPAWLALLALPGIVAGFGVLAPAGRSGLVASGPGLLLLALAARHAYAAWLPLREPVETAQLDAAALGGLSRARTWWRVVRPASAPRALAAFVLVFLLCLAEIGPAVLLSPPGRQTLVQQVFNAMHYGYDEAVASACLASAVAVAAGSFALAHATRAAASRVGR